MLRAVVGLAVAVAATGCGGGSAAQCTSTPTITVLAAASLTEAFTAIRDVDVAANPCVAVVLDFGGSQQLVAQLQQGSPGDVLATADLTTMQSAQSLGLIAGEPRVFARNRLQIVVAPHNPKGIQGLNDLARSDIKLVLAAPSVPVGRLADQVLRAAQVKLTPVSLETDVKAVLSKVMLLEADAGIVYVTDVRAAGDTVTGVDIPDAQNRVTTYHIALTSHAADASAAQRFVDFVTSAAGLAQLSGRGFLAP